MVTLARIDGRTLMPNLDTGLAVLREGFGTADSRATERRRQQLQQLRLNAIQGALGAIGGSPPTLSPGTAAPGAATPGINPGAPGPSTSPQALNRASLQLSIVAPDVSRAFEAARAANDTRTQAAIKAAADEGARNAAFIKRQPPEQRQAAFRTVAADLMRQGKTQEAQRWIEMGNKPVDQQNLDIEKILIGSRAVDKLSEPLTPIAEVEEDFRAGRISEDQRDAALASVAASAPTQFSPGTEILADGTVIQAGRDGQVVVRAPDGRIVEGQERLDILKAAQQAKRDQLRAESGAKAAGTQAIKLSGDMLEQLTGVRDTISNLREARQALADGAQTGPIMSRVASIRPASARLDNIQKRLGLNVIQNTTFGALSQGELALALSTALPTNLPSDELQRWIDEKVAAQEKLATYLENAAIFLGTEGNTAADWMQLQRDAARERNETTGGQATVNVNGRQVPVGSVITNRDGQKGRVNADGSITRLDE